MFTCFPKLTIELRLAIWRLACYVPRELDVHVAQLESTLSEDPEDYDDEVEYVFPAERVRFSSSRAVPAILHATQEARAEALKHYTLAFQYGDVSSTIAPPKIYVNPVSDRVHFMPKKLHAFVPDEIVHALATKYSLQCLAFTYGAVQEYTRYGEPSFLITSSGTVKELTVYNDKVEFKKGELVRMQSPGPGPEKKTKLKEMKQVKQELQRAWRSPGGRFQYAPDESLWPRIILKTLLPAI